MQSSTAEPVADEVADEPTPPPSPLILLEPADDADVCAVDGWCA